VFPCFSGCLSAKANFPEYFPGLARRPILLHVSSKALSGQRKPLFIGDYFKPCRSPPLIDNRENMIDTAFSLLFQHVMEKPPLFDASGRSIPCRNARRDRTLLPSQFLTLPASSSFWKGHSNCMFLCVRPATAMKATPFF